MEKTNNMPRLRVQKTYAETGLPDTPIPKTKPKRHSIKKREPSRTMTVSIPLSVFEKVHLVAQYYDVPISATLKRYILDGLRKYTIPGMVVLPPLGNPFDPMPQLGSAPIPEMAPGIAERTITRQPNRAPFGMSVPNLAPSAGEVDE